MYIMTCSEPLNPQLLKQLPTWSSWKSPVNVAKGVFFEDSEESSMFGSAAPPDSVAEPLLSSVVCVAQLCLSMNVFCAVSCNQRTSDLDLTQFSFVHFIVEKAHIF